MASVSIRQRFLNLSVSAPNATIADTVLDETVPEEELPERAIANVVDVVVSAPKKRKLLNARSDASHRSSKTGDFLFVCRRLAILIVSALR